MSELTEQWREELPLFPEDVRLIRVCRIRCYYCGTALGWTPLFENGAGDKGDYCHKCGATAVRITEGRPIGRNSRDWEAAVEWVRIGLSVADESGLADEIEATLIRNAPPVDAAQAVEEERG